MSSITIYDIAREANVSIATVSRVISDSEKVSDKTKEKIRRLIEQYGYQPNAMAQSLNAGRTNLIGLIVADIRNPFFARVCYACETAAKQKGFQIMLRNIFDNNSEEESLNMFAAHRVDAVIQLGGCVDSIKKATDYANLINRLSKPFISINNLEGADMYTIGIDDAAGTELAFTHLLELGHTRIAFLGGMPDRRSTIEKHNKYVELLKESNIPFYPEYVQINGYSAEEGLEGMRYFLSLEKRPTAVIAVTDEIGAGAAAAVRESGLDCPRDISIIGNDNTFLTYITTPKLTSVACDYNILGESLITAAQNVIAKEDVEREVYLKPLLVKRNSCGPCNGIQMKIQSMKGTSQL